jgi:hypothetical protein
MEYENNELTLEEAKTEIEEFDRDTTDKEAVDALRVIADEAQKHDHFYTKTALEDIDHNAIEKVVEVFYGPELDASLVRTRVSVFELDGESAISVWIDGENSTEQGCTEDPQKVMADVRNYVADSDIENVVEVRKNKIGLDIPKFE